ncbi:MAG: B12-binding domain-containing radical SAM protein [Candidatus Aenigmarchaeota archaeon]|nr:B12-binding domain-containing radical SAM protein [Candidatus Aenigmarchaeota archaeon]
MKIALIHPFGFDVKYVMPLAMGYLKSNTDKKHDTRLFDFSLDKIPADSARFIRILENFSPDIVCTSCWGPTYKESVRILKVAKALNPQTVTCLGGVQITSYAGHIIKYETGADFLFRGECELSFPVFVEEIDSQNGDFSKVRGLMHKDKDGNIVENMIEQARDCSGLFPAPPGNSINSLDDIIIPDYKAMRLQDYLKQGYKFSTTHNRNAPVWITRGCGYRCEYCAAPQLNGKLIRAHSIKYSLAWIRHLKEKENIEHINIIDDNFTFHLKYAKEFCKALIEENIDVTMGTPNGIRMQRFDEEMAQLMKKAGWENVVIAPESGSVSTLERMKKDLKPDIVPPIVKMIKKNGLKAHGFFILGYPGDTKEDLEMTLKFMHECDFDFFFLNNFQALSGTPVFNKLVERGEIQADFLPKNYSDGSRAYTPETLKDVNFPKLVLSQYMKMYAKSPSKLFYALKLFHPHLVVKKITKNIRNSVQKEEQIQTVSDEEFDRILEKISKEKYVAEEAKTIYN